MENPFKKYYDRVYSENENFFGRGTEKPSSLVRKIPEYLKGGSVLELGTGQGRNALWLARQGFEVDARDISQVGIKQIQKVATEEKLPVRASCVDMREPLIGMYDAIMSTAAFHYISRKDALELIQEMKLHTNPLGVNVIAAFTQDGDFFKNNPEGFYPNRLELKEIYNDWEVLTYDEISSPAMAKKEDGSPMINTIARLIARKS